MTRRRAYLLVFACALAVRLANLWVMAGLPVAEYQRTWTESDMGANYAWSGRILAGDVLGREPVHQYVSWMKDIAPLETWERWWGGKSVFRQAPLYAYLLALMRWVAGDGFWAIGLGHLLLGLANVGLVMLLADRIFGATAAVVAGLGAALYGPFLLHETLLLRDTLAVTTSLLLVWALARAEDPRPLRWLVAGLLFAVAVLARETTLLFAPFVLLLAVQRFWRRRGACATALACFIAGLLLGVLPLVARNLAVGVAPWSLSASGVEAFIFGHGAGSSPVGLMFPPGTRSILEASDGHLGPAIRLTLATYEGNWWGLLAHEVAKLRAIVSCYEATDNANWYYFADRSPILGWSLRYEFVLAFGLVGLWTPTRRGDDRVLVYFLLAALASLLYATVIGRYRLVPAAVLLVYAGAAVTWIVQQVVARRWRTAAGAGAAVVGLLALSATALHDVEVHHRYRAGEFSLAAEYEYHHGEPARALEELRAGLATAYRGPDQLSLPADYTSLVPPFVALAHLLGQDAEAAAELNRLVRDYPDDPNLHRILAVLYRDDLARPDLAAEHFAAESRLQARPPSH
jgi:hypothetical protein